MYLFVLYSSHNPFNDRFLKNQNKKKNLDMSKLKNSSGEFSFTVAYYFNRDTYRF